MGLFDNFANPFSAKKPEDDIQIIGPLSNHPVSYEQAELEKSEIAHQKMMKDWDRQVAEQSAPPADPNDVARGDPDAPAQVPPMVAAQKAAEAKQWQQRQAAMPKPVDPRNVVSQVDVPQQALAFAGSDPDARAAIQSVRDEFNRPQVAVSRPVDTGVGRDYLASIPGAQPSQAVASESGGPQGALVKAIMGAGVRPEVAQYIAAKQAGQPSQPAAQSGGDAELAQAQRKAALLSGLADVSQGLVGMMGAGIGAKQRPDTSFYDRMREDAQQPVADLLQRRAEATRQAQAGVQARQVAQQQALADPDSPESQRARAFAKGIFSETMKSNPQALASFDTMSADEITRAVPVVQKLMEAEGTAALRKLQADREARLEHKSAGGGSGGSGGGGGSLLSQGALDQAAQRYLRDGSLPSLGSGKQAAADRAAIVNRAAKLGGDTDLASAAADYKANAGSLRKLQTQADNIDAFESTALRNIQTLRDELKKAGGTSSPLLNAPWRAFQAKVLGDPDLAGLNAARQTALSEVTKILSGATGAGAPSDSARHEVETMMGPDMSVAQIERALDILTRDMHNRKQATHAQLEEIRGRLGGKKAQQPGAQPATSSAKQVVRKQYSASRNQTRVIYSDGSVEVVDGQQ